MKTTYIELRNGTRIEALLSGGTRGPALLLCHGNSARAQGFAGLLASGCFGDREVIAISLPGHGASGREPEAGYCLPALAEALRQVIARLGRERLVLCGHSLGGHLMTQILPSVEQACAIALISAPPLNVRTLARTFKPDPTGGALFRAELSDDDVDAFARALVSPPWASEPAFTAMASAIRATDPLFRPALGRSVAAGEFGDELACLRAAKVPIALFGGRRDAFLADAAYEGLELERLWRGRPTIFERAGHSPHIDAEAEFAAVFSSFVDELG
jgi:pimeloyl-ACP methyl ester carboxylesterase